ncbi:MAG: tRNA (N(6)-L-threonylcarbamoyladenosine(37)-C(2))-methylthiotransferase MtaB [Dysgonamonadaceae bacterium]|jgi:threonylcarbamoyladenosine tRNA methylthiotransferase MtaB|nr:tRNA (N(6)-L-threonylcarbamoyladenosine(37)-C(2))-methylthiotransferase MtaB [Dysgonamonadaceae bacterium]
MTAAYYTLGCKLNFAETSTVGKQLAAAGIRKAEPEEQVDICVINTCSVTEQADKKCRNTIRRISRQHPDAMIIVTGCYAQLNPNVVSQIEGVDLVLGANEKANVTKYIEKYRKETSSRDNERIFVGHTKSINAFIPSCSKGDRTRYFLKVQDGCDYFCTYCTVPHARGRSRNGTVAEIVQLAQEAGAQGGKEIVLTGINIGDFGKSTGETFMQLIQALEKVESVERIRISSIEPNLLTDEIIEFISRSKRFAPHFHIPLQSGSDDVLRLMKRKYNTSLFAEKVFKIKSLMPDAFIGTDVIAGSRGETAEYFEAGRKFIESLPISKLHVFNYSERQGTKAIEIAHRVEPRESKERSRQLIELSQHKIEEFYRLQQKTTHDVLFEHTKKGNKMYGFTENYLKVEANFLNSWINRLIPVTLDVFNEKELCFTI